LTVLNNVELYCQLICVGIYTGTDNKWYLKWNIKRLQAWVFKIHVEQQDTIEINGELKKVKFTVAADLSSLQALFGPEECFYCPIPAGFNIVSVMIFYRGKIQTM
jgi:hypothetical protein